ncbi:TPA: pheA operon leader peptide PheL [Escherichia coli]|nr:pheA operon leader peptide PheL [Shigella dysenteriae]EHY2869579.1 pheA operon leader peptide PheL [Escherichia coli]MED7191058.1 pheA operon leader peptide PheL [Escherichia coli O157]EIE5330363.1 pheA operon leader peptide PheL [Escherichia coli]EIE5333232.1 pheA operon leader peptide PheL [Escherichia coli]EIF4365699.1 pheA operon leader peptide PheL [Escherichia coli]
MKHTPFFFAFFFTIPLNGRRFVV